MFYDNDDKDYKGGGNNNGGLMATTKFEESRKEDLPHTLEHCVLIHCLGNLER